VLLLALALEAFVLLTPFFMQWVVDDVLVSGDRDLLLTLGVGFGLLVLIQVLTAAGRAWAVLVLSATLNLQWLLNVFAHLLRLPVSWFEKRHIGDIWSRFASVQQIQKALTTSFVEAFLDGALVADAGDDALQPAVDSGGSAVAPRPAGQPWCPKTVRRNRRCAACRRSSCLAPRSTVAAVSARWWPTP
jgi:ABC-type multidrug transport system fused ATPase/permease subunit